MNVDELRALARAAEPLPGASGGRCGGEQPGEHGHLLARFRERVTLALNALTLGQLIAPELAQELRLMAAALAGGRGKAEAAFQGESPGSGE